MIDGPHLTPGIVDCHSHTGISKGINDSGQAVTAEVRIGDVTDPDHISWYRQLAGGVTTVHTLHGSANPIGGQNQINKIRWGALHPDDMHLKGAMPGIKFALGENVKQSNWGDEFTVRYPQTRMGVETLIRDRFLAAREYLEGHDRVDLELEALAEILQGKRLVHCHSYRQDEILMLCRIAQEFGFRIGTFQHVLEGYKVAEAIKAHAIGASAFSDWWAYKVEVQDAIPFNGTLMHEVGVSVSFNSDSNDLARRLNVEAAKAVKYGGVKPEEALRFVTLNAARQLAIDDRVGSLEVGKDADLVLWSGSPLSTYARCVATWIDGREYFSLEQDRKHRERIAAERRRLIAKLLGQKKEKPDYEDEDEEEDGRRRRKRPIDRAFQRSECGVCGCTEEEESR
ncbi:MAG: amidohydrolase [Planctomycetota bacterium]